MARTLGFPFVRVLVRCCTCNLIVMDSPSDVFSLSDHLLAERLQFVKEVGSSIHSSVLLIPFPPLDRLWKLGQCMALSPKVFLGQGQGYRGRGEARSPLQNIHHCRQSTLIVRLPPPSPFSTHPRAHVRWNEMKIVRSFKNDPHPSIVPFHSFIITPSYALITMSVSFLSFSPNLIRLGRAYLPTPVPVEVSEPRAKEWFKSLLSGVHFLHSRGVVHNDIKYVHPIVPVTQHQCLIPSPQTGQHSPLPC